MGFLLENLGVVMRLVLIAASLLCFTSDPIKVCIGITFGVCVFAYQKIVRKQHKKIEQLS
jgi:hypothetical protein